MDINCEIKAIIRVNKTKTLLKVVWSSTQSPTSTVIVLLIEKMNYNCSILTLAEF